MTKTITLIYGDGIGQEVIPATQAVIEALSLDIDIQIAEAGFTTFEQRGTALPAETIAYCEASDAILFGATQSPMTKVEGYYSPILALRKHFGLYANLRPAIQDNIDLLVVRENSEGLYSGRENLSADGDTAITERIITRHASERIVRIACDYAQERHGKLTIVHKANVLKETCGLFRQVALEVASEYPNLDIEEMLVDACAMRMAQDASPFDVIVSTNLFGDILSDLAAGLTGGLGIAPSANIGGRIGLFEPVHGSAPDIAGTGTADPRASILSASMLLNYLGLTDIAQNLQHITYNTQHSGNTSTTTQDIINAVLEVQTS